MMEGKEAGWRKAFYGREGGRVEESMLWEGRRQGGGKYLLERMEAERREPLCGISKLIVQGREGERGRGIDGWIEKEGLS